MAEYNFTEIEKKWQKYWSDNKTYKSDFPSKKQKFYVLDMFPYPSGAGLHVGHPLGYIASDIFSRYKRHKGFNVLHPMGFDSFGLPAEQYAIQTGQHPAITTEINISTYKRQLNQLGFSFDWDREVKTSNPSYYKWTQWIFIQLFNSWYNKETDKAEDISLLKKKFAQNGTEGVQAVCDFNEPFTAKQWEAMSKKERNLILLNFRLAFLKETVVNWCPALGTVLANDEVKDGVSERGGHPVVQKKMMQWSLRISAYAERLLQDLDVLNWPESIKDIQRNWIGKSKGATLFFKIYNSENEVIEVFTTRPDTIFGVTYIALAPEHELVDKIVTNEQKKEVDSYVKQSEKRSERDRMSDVKTISGVFTGSYAIHPFTGEKLPIWLADYVLASYGTGAVMAVPAHDSRDYAFAKHFYLSIKEVVSGGDIQNESYDAKSGVMINSDFLNGLNVNEALVKSVELIENKGVGKGKINYRLRDAVFGRQRYWGEPIPIYYVDDVPYPVPENELPVLLPEIDKYLPTEDGEPPLARAKNWKYNEKYHFELSTMPGWAGSSWYFLRYMSPNKEDVFVDAHAFEYWKQIDLYFGGAEHATGHLLYFRFWTKFLFDKGFINIHEPAQKLINQGMIQGRSNFVYKIKGQNTFVSYGLKNDYDCQKINVDIHLVENDVLDIEKFKKDERFEAFSSTFILENDKYICGWEVEKMSKSKWNVVNPDHVIEKFGADTLRMYEMFLGPIEDAKPWNTNGIDGVHKFLKKFWRLFENGTSNDAPTHAELKILHETIKKIEWDIENFSFNTSVSQFMICTNKLTELKCNKRAILEPLVVCLSPFAPHICEELWFSLGKKESIEYESFPNWNEAFLVEDVHKYPVSINGKMRVMLEFSVDLSVKEIEKKVLTNEVVLKWLDGNEAKKVIVVPKKIVNIVV